MMTTPGTRPASSQTTTLTPDNQSSRVPTWARRSRMNSGMGTPTSCLPVRVAAGEGERGAIVVDTEARNRD